MISSITETNNQLTKYVIGSFNQNDMPINELVLQKVIYKIKMGLGSNHPLYDDLPYYWYYYGPFSETLNASFLNLKNYLKPVGDCFFIKDSHIGDFEVGIIDEYLEIEDVTYDLISKGDYVYSSLTEDIYKQFAPLDMIHTFKYGIFNPTENDVFLGNVDEYVENFKGCLYDLYLNLFNQDYNFIFSKFQMQIELLNDDDLVKDNWGILRLPIRNLWFTFAKGLRIMFHDSYYDRNCNEWNIIFYNNISKLNSDLTELTMKTNDLIDLSKYGDITEFDRKFMGHLVDIYLKED